MRLLQDKSERKTVHLGGKMKENTGTIFRHQGCRLLLIVNQLNVIPMGLFHANLFTFCVMFTISLPTQRRRKSGGNSNRFVGRKLFLK